MSQKTLVQINAFAVLAKEKFSDIEKIQYALTAKFESQFTEVDKQLRAVRKPYNDALILKGIVYDEGDKKGSLRRDEKGNPLYTPETEIELREKFQETEIEVSKMLFDIETYYLAPEIKPENFTDEDAKTFDGFIEFMAI